MAPTLYQVDLSPPVRAVRLTAAAINLELDIHFLDVIGGEHLKPEFLKINPQHTVPTLVDGSFTVWDSHAICAYLIGKYAKGSPLYPEDVEKKATIDQRLHFDTGILFPLLKALATPLFQKRAKELDPKKVEDAYEAYGFLNTFLDGHEWLAGDWTTICDLCTIATVSSLDFLVPIDADDYPNLYEWVERCKKLPYYEINQEGLEKFKSFFDPEVFKR